jgi:uncharacterized protein
VAIEASGRLVGRLSRSGHDIVVRGRVKADVEMACVRCLAPAPIAVDAELSLLLQPKSRSETRRSKPRSDAEYEFRSSDADLDVYDGETVVLDGFVREAILLEMPSFPLCRESCPGLRHEEDQEAPGVDPRLLPLDAFRDKSDEPVTIDTLVSAARERAAALGRKPMLKSNQSGPSRKKR